jgi:hypothetical protein
LGEILLTEKMKRRARYKIASPVHSSKGDVMAVELIKIPVEHNRIIYVSTPNASSDRGGTASGRVRALAEQVKESDFQAMVCSVANLMKGAFDKLEDVSKVTIEVGLDIGWEGGQLIALLLRGKVDATFKLTVEWSKNG